MEFGSWKTGIVCALILSTAFVCRADIIYSFSIFNDPGWASDNRLNFTVAISDEGQNKVGFLFQNASSINSTIAAIYFDCSGLLQSEGTITSNSGVSFSVGASPKSLPAGNELTPAFPKTPFFAADADSPAPQNGINRDEWLKITFNLNKGKKFDSVIELFNAGSSRIGIHIQALPDGSSVSAINKTTPITVPEPATIALLALGSIVLFRKTK